ncbi:MAG: polysaccharide biosynthesis protein [Firmicutes bacterium]|nr:polysaccharide biosynthesis protein [Bacillota bacterium]
MFFDILFINLTLWLSFTVRFEGSIPLVYRSNWLYYAVLVTSLRMVCFYVFGLYNSLWGYSSLPEMIQIIKAITASSVLIYLVDQVIFNPSPPIPKSIHFISLVINLFMVGGSRLAIRLRQEMLNIFENRKKQRRRVLVIGAGQAGALIIREMQQQPTPYLPVAILDDNFNKIKRYLHGVPVVGSIKQLPQAVREYQIDEVLVAIPSAPKKRLREIVALARETGLPIRIIPGLLAAGNVKVTLDQVREVQIEDLLGREPVKLNVEEIAGYLKGERVLVTGAGGSIGSELCRQVARFEPECLLLLGRGENSIYEIDQELKETFPALRKTPVIADVRDRGRLEQIFREYRPTVVFHAAAHKHVPLMESAPDEAVKNNVFGTRNVAELSDKYGVKRFVMISTDKAVNPTSVMGATKRVAEMLIQLLARKSKTKFCAVRFGNVLGSRGSVIPLFQHQIAKGGPVTVTDPEMVRFFMTIPEAVSLVIQAGAMGEYGEIFILDMGEPVKIVDLAHDLIRLSGLVPGEDIKIEFCGIRPGEKLYEEILTSEEGTNATRHERIFVSKPNDLDPELFWEDLTYLEKWVATADRVKVVAKLKQMIPRYTPSDYWRKQLGAAVQEETGAAVEARAVQDKGQF